MEELTQGAQELARSIWREQLPEGSPELAMVDTRNGLADWLSNRTVAQDWPATMALFNAAAAGDVGALAAVRTEAGLPLLV